MALSIAKEKNTRRLDQALLERFAVKAGLPKHMVVETALETAERTVHAWSEMAPNLPLQNHAREQIDDSYGSSAQRAVSPWNTHQASENLPAKKRTQRSKRLAANSPRRNT